MKKIICLIENLLPGGAERQMAYLASSLKEEGNEVQIWTYYEGNFYQPLLEKAGVAYRYMPQAEGKLKRIPVLLKEMKSYKPDVVIAYLDTACMVACIIKAIRGRFRLIVSERNTTQNMSIRERVKFFLYRFADWIVPNSETQAVFIKENTPPHIGKKLKVINNYVDVEKFRPLDKAPEWSELKVIVVGRIMPQKNPVTLMEAVRVLKESGMKISVDWYGNTYSEDYNSQCVDKINQLGIADTFTFKAATQDIAHIYGEYNVFCLPSVFEGYSNVLCEAMCCGLPILCSDVADNARIVSEGENAFLFYPNEITSIVQTFERFNALGEDEKRLFAKNSRRLALERFSKEKFIKSYLALIT